MNKQKLFALFTGIIVVILLITSCGGNVKTTNSSSSGKTYTTPPPMTIDENKTYTATMKTNYGDIVIQLFPKEAPITVNNFVFLCPTGFL